MAGLIVLDASAIIALFDHTDSHHEWALKMLRDTAAFDLATSTLTYAETLIHPTKAGKKNVFESAFAGLGVKVHPLLPGDALDLADVRNQTSLRMPDAVVLALAVKLGANIATTDQELGKAARKRKIGVFQPG